MILVTVGMQLGFDRLIEAMDELAPSLDMPVIAQTGRSSYQPANMEAREKIAPSEFEELVKQSRVIVSHAGIGTVLTAQRLSTPIVLFPRRYDFGEHRNDHQVATVRNLEGRPGVLIAFEQQELAGRIAEGLELASTRAALSPTKAQLQSAIVSFIETGNI
ncbi:beta-1,4-galactosyltransferase [Erythrobacter sp. NAP1]|uniref:glycosyltransferase n=1 Tax=Erythrobacter sp. NAP1 TaxID=237727 RepID=UPI0000687A02|nr:glycosyltransferase [Erythrobacter sp. NAP1]EAQ28202.1 beta-1,4-galactosyltransferase [Erythrobacter sp. NAP1]